MKTDMGPLNSMARSKGSNRRFVVKEGLLQQWWNLCCLGGVMEEDRAGLPRACTGASSGENRRNTHQREQHKYQHEAREISRNGTEFGRHRR
jgi:hypothetical protein